MDERSRLVNSVKLPISAGTEFNLLDERFRLVNAVKLPISGAKVVSCLLERRSSVILPLIESVTDSTVVLVFPLLSRIAHTAKLSQV